MEDRYFVSKFSDYLIYRLSDKFYVFNTKNGVEKFLPKERFELHENKLIEIDKLSYHRILNRKIYD